MLIESLDWVKLQGDKAAADVLVGPRTLRTELHSSRPP